MTGRGATVAATPPFWSTLSRMGVPQTDARVNHLRWPPVAAEVRVLVLGNVRFKILFSAVAR